MDAALRQVPGFLFFDHIAVSVKPGELEPQVIAYKAMGFKELHREDVLGADQVREVLLQVGDGPNLIQLLEPLTPDSPVAKQLEKNGGRGGLAHIAFRVADIGKAFSYMKEHGFKILDAAPRKGSRGTTVFFVHPRTTEAVAFGYLFEVVQEGV
jgi:methylmalonyl-CoA/ethylmalonyl-CoA epimerase